MSDDERRHRIEMLEQDLEQQQAGLAEMQRQLGEISATAVSPRRELSVTVGQQGVITELKFLTSSYRKMPKNEIAELITSTIEAARNQLNQRAAEIMSPMMPAGFDVQGMVSGELSTGEFPSLDSLLPDSFHTPRAEPTRPEGIAG